MTGSYLIEETVIKIFRLLVVIRILLGGVPLLFVGFFLEEPVPLIRLIGQLIFSLLALYLSIPILKTWLQRFYLPIALVIAIVVSILEQQILLWQQLYIGQEIEVSTLSITLNKLSIGTAPLLENTGIWLPFLFVPLVIVAWRYGFRSVIIFCVLMIGMIVGFHVLFGNFDTHILLLLLYSLNGQIFVSLAIGYVIAHLNNVQKQQHHELEQANRKLQQHTIVLEQLTISHERNRLARELHDTLAHTLSGTTVQLEASETLRSKDPAKSQELVQQSLHRLRSGLTETRRALEALRASPLDDLGLLLALRQLIKDYEQRTGWVVELQILESSPEISPTVEQTLYRCTQEVLSNIDRHAVASKVDIKLNATEQLICLSIRDNGRGFDLGKMNTMDNRFGVIGMQERVEALGGLLEIDSQFGHGTTVNIEMRMMT